MFTNIVERISFIILYILYFSLFYFFCNWWNCGVFLVVWALPISYTMNNIRDTWIEAYKLMPNELVEKYGA